MAKPTPLPFYDEFMTIFKNHNISNWEAKDFVKLIMDGNVKINKKNQFKIYKALKILVRYKYLWANSNMRCDSFKSHMIINKLSKFL